MLSHFKDISCTQNSDLHSLSSRKVMGLFPGWVIPKTLKMEPVAFSLGAQLMRLEQGQCFITGLLNGCRSWVRFPAGSYQRL